jgi:hypothetical protein
MAGAVEEPFRAGEGVSQTRIVLEVFLCLSRFSEELLSVFCFAFSSQGD